MTFTFKSRFIYSLILFWLTATIVQAKTDKYRCIWRDNPATTMTIGWNQISGKNPVVYYDVVDNGTKSNLYAFYQKPNKVLKAKGMNNHFVRLTKLQPNTSYYFVIKDSEGVSQRFWFKTAPDNPYERLSIVAGGDSRNHRNARRNANKIVSRLRPHCVVFGGDMTGLDRAGQWKKWFDDWQHTIGKDGRMIPIIAARGNHEFSNKSLVNLFDVPHPNVYYALTLGGSLLRVYTLNTMIATGGNQKKWLESDLQQHGNIRWKMAQYHHPMRPHTAKKAEGQKTYRNWAKIFYDYGVRLVVECDAHVVKTTWPVRPSYERGHDMGFVRDDKNGITFVGEGCWGAPIRANNDDKKWTRNSGSFNQVKWVFVDYDGIEVRTVKTDNADKVGIVNDANIFTPPSNINIWKPSNGSVVKVRWRGKSTTKPIKKSTKAKTPKKSKVNHKKTDTPKPVKVPAKPVKKPVKKVSKKVKTSAKKSTDNSVELPLIVHSFEANLKENKVTLDWKTNSEPSNVICEIQRSTNGFDFMTISKLMLLGNSKKMQTYQMTDNKVATLDAPFVFYRLKHINLDGSFTLTNKQLIHLKTWEKYKVLPMDKETGNVFLEFNLKKDANVGINIYNQDGTALVSQTYLKQLSGDQIKSVNVNGLSKGTFLIDVDKGNDEHEYWRVMKE